MYFGHDPRVCELLNWEKKIERLKNVFNLWKNRKLTLYGKITVVKQLALSLITYNLMNIDTPEWVLKTVEKECWTFIWDGKKDKISRKCMIRDHSDGGISMVDLRAQHQGFLALWVKRLNQGHNVQWKLIPKYYFSKCGIDNLIFNMNFCRKGDCPKLPVMPTFYKEIILAWHQAGGGVKKVPETAKEIMNEVIWGNQYIKLGNRTLYYKHWIECDLIHIRDVFMQGKYINAQDLFLKLHDRHKEFPS